jgi:hypothetical protein
LKYHFFFFTCKIAFCTVHLILKFIVLTLITYYINFYHYKFHIFYTVDKLESLYENLSTDVSNENCNQNVTSAGLNTNQLESSNLNSYTPK